jgi:uncharacterized protein YhjY with autotransporter beta-barrel domain
MKLFRGGICLLAIALIELHAVGQTTTYTGPDSSDFETGSNYSNGAPDAGQGPVFLPNSTTIDITQTKDDTIPSLEVTGPGTINFDAGGHTLEITGATPASGTNNIGIEDATFNYSGGSLIFDDGIFDVSNGGTFNLQSGTLNYDQQTTADATQISVGNGSSGTFNQSAGTTVTTGNDLFIGEFGGTGVYTISSGASLSTGSMLGTAPFTYFIVVGADNSSATTSNGTLNIQGTLNLNPGGVLDLGAAVSLIGSAAGPPETVSSTETVVQSGNSSLVNIEGGAAALIGDAAGTNATYDLSSGTLHVFDNAALVVADGTSPNNSAADEATTVGVFNQSGGTLTADTGSTIVIGLNGQGTYNLYGTGVANFASGFEVGGDSNSDSLGSGALNQFGGTLTSTAESFIGGATGTATGTYGLSNGTATFNGGLDVGATGTVNQDGGTLTVASGKEIDLSATGSSYNLDGGTLVVGTTGINDGTTGGGTLNLGGGTLQPSTGSGTVVDALDGTVTGNSTLDTTNAGITLTGNLTGTGGFTITGGGIVHLTTSTAGTTAAAYSGPTIISGSSTLDLGAPNATDIFNSSIQGSSGTLSIAHTLAGSTLELTSNPDFTGITMNTGNAATLQLFGGTLGSIDPTTPTADSLLLGGDTTVATSGTLNLTGTNGFTGTTKINNDFTLLANSLDSTMVTNDGTLGSNAGTIGTQFNIGGLPTAGAGTGLFTQPMMATQAQEGTLLIRVAGDVSDNFSIGTTGTTLASEGLFGIVGVSGFSAVGTTQYAIVKATTVLQTGTLNSDTAAGLYAQTGNSALLSATLSQNGTTLYLNVTQLPISQFAMTPNQAAVGNSLDGALSLPSGGGGDALFTTLNTLTAGEIPGALDQLSPRTYLYMRDIAFENSTFLAQSVDGRLANIRAGYAGLDTSGLSIVNPGLESGLGRSLSSLLAYNNEGVAPNGVNYYPDDGSSPSPSPQIEPSGMKTISDSPDMGMAPPTTAAAPTNSFFDAPNVNEFISGDVILADLNQNSSNNSEPAAHYTAGDATAGISFKMASNLAAGVLFDYNHTDARTDTQGSYLRQDTYAPGIFLTFFQSGFYVNGLFSFGFDKYSNKRVISFGGSTSQASSSPDGQQYVGDIDLGYDFHPLKNSRALIIGPTAGIDYTHYCADSFNEIGAGLADLNVNSQSADSLRARVGGHVVYQVPSGSILFQPNLTASYQHEFLDNPFDLTSNFGGISGTTPFATQGSNSGRDTALLGVGLTATLDNSLNLYLNYLAEFGGSDYLVQSIQGGLKATF